MSDPTASSGNTVTIPLLNAASDTNIKDPQKPINNDRRYSPNGNKNYGDLARGELHYQQREIIRLKATGLSSRAIIAQIGTTMQTISNTMNMPMARKLFRELSKMRDLNSTEMARQFKEMLPHAKQVLEEVMYASEKDSDRLNAAKYVLGVAGVVPMAKRDPNLRGGLFTDDELKAIAKRGMEAGIVVNDVDEAEYEDITGNDDGKAVAAESTTA